jgi:hypothetical protein
MRKSNLLSTAICIPATLILTLLIFAGGLRTAAAASGGWCNKQYAGCLAHCPAVEYGTVTCGGKCRDAYYKCTGHQGWTPCFGCPPLYTVTPGLTGGILDPGPGLPPQGPARTGTPSSR